MILPMIIDKFHDKIFCVNQNDGFLFRTVLLASGGTFVDELNRLLVCPLDGKVCAIKAEIIKLKQGMNYSGYQNGKVHIK